MSSTQLDKQPYVDGQPLLLSQPAHRKLGNPGPLGLFSFASTTLILSLYNVGARGIAAPNAVVGMAIGVGGLAQILAGMWEFAVGNSFGATAFTSYGGFWISFALIFIPGTGILAAYEGEAEELGSALGIYLMTWFAFTFIMFLGTLRTNIALASVFFFLFTTFALLGAANFTANLTIQKAGGTFGIITALLAYYTGAAQLYTPENTYIALPLGSLSA